MVQLTAYDCSAVLTDLGGNPANQAEFERCIDGVESPELGSRPIWSSHGSWASGTALGFYLTVTGNFGAVIEYQFTAPEAGEYLFDIDANDGYGDLLIAGTVVAYELSGASQSINTPIILDAGTYTMKLRFQVASGAYGFAIRWQPPSGSELVPIDNSAISLSTSEVPHQELYRLEVNEWDGDIPHRLAIRTNIDGVGSRRRIIVRNRNTESYIISGVTDANGFLEFTHMPAQSLGDPHVVICYDDRKEEFVNALIYDRVFQVNDMGYPPES